MSKLVQDYVTGSNYLGKYLGKVKFKIDLRFIKIWPGKCNFVKVCHSFVEISRIRHSHNAGSLIFEAQETMFN